MNGKVFRSGIYISLIILLGQACNSKSIYEKSYDLKNAQWYIKSVLEFEFEIEDAQSRYDIKYNIRNTIDYPFYNMYVKCYIEDRKGKIIFEELQDITLMDKKTGKPLGEGFGGTDIHHLPIPKLTNYKFDKKGKYTLKVKQYMRQDPLPEVLSVGISIEKTD